MPVLSASPASTSPTSSSSEDPLAELMAPERLEHMGWPAGDFDPMALERDAFCEATLSSPLSFPPVPAVPALAVGGGTGAPSPLSFSTPPRDDIDMPVSAAGTDAEHDASDGILDALFAAHPSSVLGATPPPPPPRSRGGKDKTPVTPHRNARQAGMPSSTPVAQRATIRLAKEPAVINDDEKCVDIAAAALVCRFKEPLSETDVDGLTILTRIDRDALHRAAAQAASSSAAASVH